MFAWGAQSGGWTGRVIGLAMWRYVLGGTFTATPAIRQRRNTFSPQHQVVIHVAPSGCAWRSCFRRGPVGGAGPCGYERPLHCTDFCQGKTACVLSQASERQFQKKKKLVVNLAWGGPVSVLLIIPKAILLSIDENAMHIDTITLFCIQMQTCSW